MERDSSTAMLPQSEAQRTTSRVWVGKLVPGDEWSASPLLLIAAAAVDSACEAVIRELRAEHPQDVIVVLSAGGVDQKLAALTAGADDCLPVSDEFIATLHLLNVIGAHRRPPESAALSTPRVEADPLTHQVRTGDTIIPATPMEFRLLLELQKQRGKVVDHGQLERALWGESDPMARQALKQLARRLRRRLGPAKDSVVLVRGVGYILM